MLYSNTAERNGVANLPQNIDQLLNLSQLCFYLEYLRSLVKYPIYVNSGFRTPAVNTLVGGHPKSYHMQGLAADIRVKDNIVTPTQLVRIIKENPHPYYIVETQYYPTFVHVEIVGRKL